MLSESPLDTILTPPRYSIIVWHFLLRFFISTCAFNNSQGLNQVECVWATKWEVARIVFTMSRYLPFLSSALTCYGPFHILVSIGYLKTLLSLRRSGQRQCERVYWTYQRIISPRFQCGSFLLALTGLVVFQHILRARWNSLSVIYSASICFSEGILVLRTYALWGRSKRVFIFLLLLGAVSLVPTHMCVSET